MYTIPKGNIKKGSGISQKHRQTGNYQEFSYIIKVSIIDYQLYT